MKKLNSSALLQRLAKRALNPLHATRAARRHRHRKPLVRNQDDPQLKLYSQLVPDGFLHYGYFDDPTICPRDMSLNSIAFAQARYAKLVLDMVSDSDSEILDVGCGMGG